MTSPCKKHTYVFQKNVVVTRAAITRQGTLMRISERGLYKCSVCGKEYEGKSKPSTDGTNPINDFLEGMKNAE